jgi:hypothetical protein
MYLTEANLPIFHLAPMIPWLANVKISVANYLNQRLPTFVGWQHWFTLKSIESLS